MSLLQRVTSRSVGDLGEIVHMLFHSILITPSEEIKQVLHLYFNDLKNEAKRH